MADEQAYWNQMYANACDQSMPTVIHRPRVFRDGDQWCALYGDNIQVGVAGFGPSPEKACMNFDRAWCTELPSNAALEGRAEGDSRKHGDA